MRSKKWLSLLVVVIMVMGALAACSSNNNEGSNSSNTPEGNNGNNAPVNEQEAPYKITMALPIFGAAPADAKLVEQGINEIIQPKINAKVELLPISIGAWQQQLNLMTSGGEKLDMYFAFGQGYGPDVATGKVIALDDLIDQYGQDLKAQFDPVYLDAARIGGKIYGIPNLLEYSGQAGLIVRQDLVDKYNIDISAIHSLDDLDPVFQIIKENEPSITPLSITLASPLAHYRNFDPLGDSLGVLPGYDNGLKVVNLYESEWYEDTLNKFHSWFKAGYINKDAATASDFTNMSSGTFFSNFAPKTIGFVESQEKAAGMDLNFIPLMDDSFIATSNILTGLWTISQNSENPERVMEFMNLMYTDPDIANLLLWGVEGKDYVKVSDNAVDFPEGVTQETVGWRNDAWLVGNALNTYVYKTEVEDKWEQVKESNHNAIPSKALGFSFNPEPVKNEVTAVNNVVQNYQMALETGTVDPKSKLSEFRSKLKDAGIDKIIAEKQRQLDEWAATN